MTAVPARTVRAKALVNQRPYKREYRAAMANVILSALVVWEAGAIYYLIIRLLRHGAGL